MTSAPIRRLAILRVLTAAGTVAAHLLLALVLLSFHVGAVLAQNSGESDPLDRIEPVPIPAWFDWQKALSNPLEREQIIPVTPPPEAAPFFKLRQGEARKLVIRAAGGSEAAEAAVELGLQWLALHQADDGSWSLVDFNKTTREKPLGRPGKVIEVTGGDDKPGVTENKVAATAFALLPFLAAGHTHKYDRANRNDYLPTVKAGLDWLRNHQGRDGSFGGGLHAHGTATMAVAEAYGMTVDPTLKAPLRSAIEYIVANQQASGGWRLTPDRPPDLATTGWMLLALKTCEMAGVHIPRQATLDCDRFLDSVYDEKESAFKATPDAEKITPTMTALGILCRLYRGVHPRNPALRQGIEHLKMRPPVEGIQDLEYAYHATQVMRHIGGEPWDFWNLGPSGTGKDGMRDLLI
jgi:hypothetical protein